MELGSAISRITAGPADILGLPLGRLSVGSQADICVFDPEARWVLSVDNLVSQGHNTPFLGTELKGRVSWTLLSGRIVYERPKP
jgi:dihydroorotase